MKNPQYQIIRQYFNKSLEAGSGIPQFFIIEGIQYLDENSELLSIFKEILGVHTPTDLLWIRDFSEKLGKNHTIKVKTDTTSQAYKDLFSLHQYTDLGVRDINGRLQQSSISGQKILLIENIERMGISAINAFLKTAEEPMAGKLIVATTKNKSLLLDTVLSRALVFSISETIDDAELLAKMETVEFFDQHAHLKKPLGILSLGTRYRVERFVDFLQEHSNMMTYFESLTESFSRATPLYAKHEFLKKLADEGLIIIFIEGLVARYVSEKKWELANKWLATKKLLLGNVNKSQVLFYALVQL